MNKFPTIIAMLMSLGMTTSCAFFLPWQLSTALTAGDLVLSEKTGKSSSEHIVGGGTDRECQWARILEGENACMTKNEYEEYLLKKNCIEYEWNILGLPSCKNGKTYVEEEIGDSDKLVNPFLGK